MDEARKKKLIWQLPFLTLLIVGTILIIRQQHVMPYQKNAGLIFGTTYNITYQSDEDLHKEVLAKLKEVDGALSMFNEKSTITKINNNEDVTPSEMFTDVFQLAQKISQETNGSFDITVAPLVNIWGFGFKKGEEPSKHAIDSLKALIGYQKVSYDGKRVVKKDPRITLDCSAIAKGYGADVVARLLDEKGIKNYLVEIGGEVVTRGISEKRVPWKIGVTKPTEDPTETGDLQTVLNVTDKAMATSGNYRNFYYKGKRKYAHTIDPKTGYPVQHNILSATVLANDCATADAYATAFMVMGMEKVQGVLARHPELMAYLIYDDGNGQNAIWYSPSLRDKIAGQ